jgi:hypothetical protein
MKKLSWLKNAISLGSMEVKAWQRRKSSGFCIVSKRQIDKVPHIF